MKNRSLNTTWSRFESAQSERTERTREQINTNATAAIGNRQYECACVTDKPRPRAAREQRNDSVRTLQRHTCTPRPRERVSIYCTSVRICIVLILHLFTLRVNAMRMLLESGKTAASLPIEVRWVGEKGDIVSVGYARAAAIREGGGACILCRARTKDTKDASTRPAELNTRNPFGRHRAQPHTNVCVQSRCYSHRSHIICILYFFFFFIARTTLSTLFWMHSSHYIFIHERTLPQASHLYRQPRITFDLFFYFVFTPVYVAASTRHACGLSTSFGIHVRRCRWQCACSCTSSDRMQRKSNVRYGSMKLFSLIFLRFSVDSKNNGEIKSFDCLFRLQFNLYRRIQVKRFQMNRTISDSTEFPNSNISLLSQQIRSSLNTARYFSCI